MAVQVKIDPAELGAKAQAIFAERISPLIAKADRTKLVLIDINSGAYEIGTNDLELEERLLKSYPNALMVLLRADGGPTGQFGWPLTASVYHVPNRRVRPSFASPDSPCFAGEARARANS